MLSVDGRGLGGMSGLRLVVWEWIVRSAGQDGVDRYR